MKIDHNKSSTFSAKAKYKVPFGTVSITDKAVKLINEALKSKWVTRGKYVQEFEQKFAAIFGVKEAVAVSSGTDANALACATLYDFGAQRGDEIIVPALTFVATASAVFQAGFKPVFVDVKRETLNIDADKIEAAITKRTRAIMPVHLMGKPAQMDKIQQIAKKYKLFIIEDTAEAHGGEYKGKMLGTIGDMAAFSLYAAHIITTIEGGIVITNNPKMAEVLRSLRNHGIVNKFEFRRIGFSAKMNELEAAVGLGNVAIFKKILEKRRRNLKYLSKKFERFSKYFIYTKEEPHEKVGPHAFAIIVKENAGFTKNEFVQYLEASGIDSRNLFYSIPTQCAGYAFMGYKLGDFPEAEYCSNNGTHIGIHQDIELKNCDYVAEVVEEFLRVKNIL
ncbi:MAG: DegT/DnrJ/EryC1/StrS family aminotransferase [Candidatus Omnitrophica bacterium]|nr:DegT/DnrJ/EryC1/StrS family aminotransferase [Candidatus Omnitrophota bacterium]